MVQTIDYRMFVIYVEALKYGGRIEQNGGRITVSHATIRDTVWIGLGY